MAVPLNFFNRKNQKFYFDHTLYLGNWPHPISWEFSWKLRLIRLLLVFTYIPYRIIYLSIYLVIYFYSHLFSFLFLPSLTIYFILSIMDPFRYFIMFLTCSSLCYNSLVFIFLIHTSSTYSTELIQLIWFSTLPTHFPLEEPQWTWHFYLL